MGRRNRFNENLFGQKGRHGFRRKQRSVVCEATRVSMANLSLDGGKCGKPHQRESWENWMAKRIVRKARDFKRKSKNNSTNQFKTESELEGDYLENYYKFVDESSTLKHGGLNDQDLEKIRHESEVLWAGFEKKASRTIRDLEDNGNSDKDEVVNETAGLEMANGSPKLKRRRVQAIRYFPLMCGPDFGFANFTISGTKTRDVTPKYEPEEDEVYYEDQTILDARMAGSELVGIEALIVDQVEGSCNTSNMEDISEEVKAVIEESEDQKWNK
ncbi:hypothetical protein L1987_05484 [Smallanthus sonchifolius]|uniref:Uncharacterized protein n=1 Tax=Smallanthus sonchifolius TaxID=185202 RepID=A0ACB9JVG4_9ASTR|nr:hypothetical protein L1987_05484 [Smallanthus sonchifolius]